MYLPSTLLYVVSSVDVFPCRIGFLTLLPSFMLSSRWVSSHHFCSLSVSFPSQCVYSVYVYPLSLHHSLCSLFSMFVRSPYLFPLHVCLLSAMSSLHICLLSMYVSSPYMSPLPSLSSALCLLRRFLSPFVPFLAPRSLFVRVFYLCISPLHMSLVLFTSHLHGALFREVPGLCDPFP